jgi:acetyl esterase/lipase
MRWTVAALVAASLVAHPGNAFAQRAGQLVSADPVVDTPGGMQAWRIRYLTTNDAGALQEVTGMVVAPREAIPPQPRRVLAWAHGTSGVASQCAPSQMREFWTHRPWQDAVRRGYVVAAPDYPGLGSAGVHPYLIGQPTARSTLDAVRAAGQIPGAAAGKRFAVWGESQGGHAALWTGQLARSYASDLELIGVAAAAPPTGLIGNLQQGSDPSVRAFLTAFTAYSWSRYYGVPLSSLGGRQTQNIITRLSENNCVTLESKPKLGAIIGITVLRRNLRNVDLGRIQPWAGYARANSVNVAAIQVPMLVAQNPRDVIVAPAVTRQFARNACTLRKRVRWIDINGKGHQTSAADTAAMTIDWVDNRFAGRAARSDCGKF